MIKGDKIKLVKPMGVFTNVGEVCEVTDIREDGSIWFRFGGVHLGCMSYDEYEKYFEPVKEKVKREWSEWKQCLYDFDFDCRAYGLKISDSIFGDLWYRDNGKRIQIKTTMGDKNIRASATCCDNDEFDLETGLELAIKRLLPKVLAYVAESDAKNM